MECGDLTPLCSAWPDTRLYDKTPYSPRRLRHAEPGLGNQSGESSPHSKACSLWSAVFPRGAILGLHKSEIDAQFDEIVDFAGMVESVVLPAI